MMGTGRTHCGRRLTAAVLLALCCTAPAVAARRRAFATSTEGTGKLADWPSATGATALAQADSICRAAAAAATPNPLPNAGTYRAWISTSTTDAFCHVQGLTGKKAAGCGGGVLPGAGPWFLSNGATNFAGTLDQLANEGEIYRPISRDEHFDPLPTSGADRIYWTGTDEAGVWSGTDCSGWTNNTPAVHEGTVGDGYGTAGLWSKSGQFACAGAHRLLCLEPGVGEVATLGWSPAALAFVTSAKGVGNLSSWPQAAGAVGLAAGDAVCRSVAAAAFLPAPESFVAWLSTSTPLVNAVDRLEIDGPWKRVDAYTVANDLADLVDSTLDTSLHQFEDGRYLEAECSTSLPCGVWTGTDADGGGASQACNNWTDGASLMGAKGNAANGPLPSSWTQFGTTSCNVSYRLYCFSNAITIFWDGFELTGDTSRWSAAVP